MTGHSYATSARTAERMGPFAGYDENEEHMLRVLRQHQEAAAEIDEELVPAELLERRPAGAGTRPTSSPPPPACATRRRRSSRPPARSA